jgi:tRNA U55 pseudouridine synthase TruB
LRVGLCPCCKLSFINTLSIESLDARASQHGSRALMLELRNTDAGPRSANDSNMIESLDERNSQHGCGRSTNDSSSTIDNLDSRASQHGCGTEVNERTTAARSRVLMKELRSTDAGPRSANDSSMIESFDERNSQHGCGTEVNERQHD